MITMIILLTGILLLIVGIIADLIILAPLAIIYYVIAGLVELIKTIRE